MKAEPIVKVPKDSRYDETQCYDNPPIKDRAIFREPDQNSCQRYERKRGKPQGKALTHPKKSSFVQARCKTKNSRHENNLLVGRIVRKPEPGKNPGFGPQ